MRLILAGERVVGSGDISRKSNRRCLNRGSACMALDEKTNDAWENGGQSRKICSNDRGRTNSICGFS